MYFYLEINLDLIQYDSFWAIEKDHNNLKSPFCIIWSSTVLSYSLAQAVLFCSLAILFDMSKPDMSIFSMTTRHCNLAVIEINFLLWPSYLIYHLLKWSCTSGLGNLGSPCETKEWLTTKVLYKQCRSKVFVLW